MHNKGDIHALFMLYSRHSRNENETRPSILPPHYHPKLASPQTPHAMGMRKRNEKCQISQNCKKRITEDVDLPLTSADCYAFQWGRNTE